MEDLAGFAPFILLAALFWFLILRPAQRRARQSRETQLAAQVGSEIMLTSGIYGTVKDVADDTLSVEVAAGTVVKVARGAVARVIPPETPDPSDVPSSETTDAGTTE